MSEEHVNSPENNLIQELIRQDSAIEDRDYTISKQDSTIEERDRTIRELKEDIALLITARDQAKSGGHMDAATSGRNISLFSEEKQPERDIEPRCHTTYTSNENRWADMSSKQYEEQEAEITAQSQQNNQETDPPHSKDPEKPTQGRRQEEGEAVDTEETSNDDKEMEATKSQEESHYNQPNTPITKKKTPHISSLEAAECPEYQQDQHDGAVAASTVKKQPARSHGPAHV